MPSLPYRQQEKSALDSFYIHGASDNKPFIKVGYVEAVNPNTFTVDARIDRSETCEGCPVLNVVGRSLGTDLVWLQSLRGSYVVLINILGLYHVLSTLPGNLNTRDDLSAATVGLSDGSIDPTGYEQSSVRDFNQNRPNDFLSDDKIIRTEDGTELSLFRGGVVKLKASPLAQLILGKIKDFARLVARKFEIFCDFGEINSYQTSEGRTTLHIKGGAEYAEETHPSVSTSVTDTGINKSNWTVQAWLGDYPGNKDARFVLQTNNANADASSFEYTFQSADINGQIFIETTKDFSTTVGENRNIAIGKDDKLKIFGDSVTNVVGNKEVEVEQEYGVMVGTDYSLTAVNSVSLQAAKKLYLVGNEEATLSSTRRVNIFADNEIYAGVDELNNLVITKNGFFVTNNGIINSPFLMPPGVMGGVGPIETGFPATGEMGMLSSFAEGSESEELSPCAIGAEGDLVITLTQASAGKAIYLAANPDTYIKISQEGITIKGENITIDGHEEEEGEGGEGGEGP